MLTSNFGRSILTTGDERGDKAGGTTVDSAATMATDPSKYVLNHTMLRVKDPAESIKFYNLLGLTKIHTLPFSTFTLYFLAHDSPSAAYHGAHFTSRPGILELTHNHGTESSPEFKGYHSGNSEPKGFGHICISVDNLQAACSRIAEAGYKFQKKLEEGRMRSIAFVLDPDGYWVEIVGARAVEETVGVTETAVEKYRFNHTMIRVKSAETSLSFYQKVLGMSLLRTMDAKEAGFTLYFLGYPDERETKESESSSGNPIAHHTGLLELTHNHGTESDPDFKGYHSGNTDPQGFGHICVSVDDLDAACARFETFENNAETPLKFKKRLTEGTMKDIAFILDPDGYWIEVLQNETLKARAKW